MGRSIAAWWPRRKASRRTSDPGTALFQGLRIRLTLWYCGVMGIALILFGVALFLGVQFALINPITSSATMHANAHSGMWLHHDIEHACPSSDDQVGPPPELGGQRTELIACFDMNGSLLPQQKTTGLPAAFLTNSLALTTLHNGHSTADSVDAGDPIGHIYRYAVLVPNASGNGSVGVVMVGEFVQQQDTTLSLLLGLLLSIGAAALLGAAAGGLFLANRALHPARLAWANQQRFIADASHELRTPLTLLRADAEVLLRGRKQFESEDAALLDDIVAEANHMGRIANNLLTLARLDNRAIHREHEVINLSELAQAGVQRVQAIAEQNQITLQVESAEALYVVGDPMQLEQAVLILLDNAIKYNRTNGQVVLRTMALKDQALLEVHDTGRGITSEHLQHLGERFYRVDKARSREAGGTGLGLSIARGIAATHGGSLTLVSTPGQSTTATLALPRAFGTQIAQQEENMSTKPEQKV